MSETLRDLDLCPTFHGALNTRCTLALAYQVALVGMSFYHLVAVIALDIWQRIDYTHYVLTRLRYLSEVSGLA